MKSCLRLGRLRFRLRLRVSPENSVFFYTLLSLARARSLSLFLHLSVSLDCRSLRSSALRESRRRKGVKTFTRYKILVSDMAGPHFHFNVVCDELSQPLSQRRV